MRNVVSALTTLDGERLHCESWLPDGEVRAEMVLVHGVGEYCGRYGRLVEALVVRGIAVHGWDQRGHGRSTGRRGHVRSWVDYREDLRLFVERLRQRRGAEGKWFLFGHSMGALVALDAVLAGVPRLAGLIVSGVPLQPGGLTRWPLVLSAKVLSRLWPTFGIRLPLKTGDMTSDEGRRAELAGDVLMHRVVTARWGTEALATVAGVRRRMGRLVEPLLVIHGALDPVNLVSGAEEFFEGVGSLDKELRLYAGSRHEPHNDVEHARMSADLVSWLEARVLDAGD